MKYFVSIENTEYHRWQIELLIQSFKIMGMENDLYIAIAENDAPQSGKYIRNITAHKHKFLHQNIGRKYNCLPLNKFFSLNEMVKTGFLTEQFAVLHPDMILYHPITHAPNDVNLLYHHNNDADDEPTTFLKKQVANAGIQWMSIGDTMILNKFPDRFFEISLEQAMKLNSQFGGNWKIERATWMISAILLSSEGIRPLIVSHPLETSLVYQRSSSLIIHYKHGIPPLFNKRHYKDSINPLVISSNLEPFDAMFAESPTEASRYLQHVVNSYEDEENATPSNIVPSESEETVENLQSFMADPDQLCINGNDMIESKVD